jgi:hypothetical protein
MPLHREAEVSWAVHGRDAGEERRASADCARLALEGRLLVPPRQEVLSLTVRRVLGDQPRLGLGFAPRRSRSVPSSRCSNLTCSRSSAISAVCGPNGEASACVLPIFCFHRASCLAKSVRWASSACDISDSSLRNAWFSLRSRALAAPSSTVTPLVGDERPVGTRAEAVDRLRA